MGLVSLFRDEEMGTGRLSKLPGVTKLEMLEQRKRTGQPRQCGKEAGVGAPESAQLGNVLASTWGGGKG